mmetsp:Transcript_41189/g.118473  ORF Transcript_41189/g.118473 Transcript_41189/m.118473 type:complete len:314 (-) Transcript_41189:720-1661(-)
MAMCGIGGLPQERGDIAADLSRLLRQGLQSGLLRLRGLVRVRRFQIDEQCPGLLQKDALLGLMQHLEARVHVPALPHLAPGPRALGAHGRAAPPLRRRRFRQPHGQRCRHAVAEPLPESGDFLLLAHRGPPQGDYLLGGDLRVVALLQPPLRICNLLLQLAALLPRFRGRLIHLRDASLLLCQLLLELLPLLLAGLELGLHSGNLRLGETELLRLDPGRAVLPLHLLHLGPRRGELHLRLDERFLDPLQLRLRLGLQRRRISLRIQDALAHGLARLHPWRRGRPTRQGQRLPGLAAAGIDDRLQALDVRLGQA